MLYLNFADYLSFVILALYALSVYSAYSLTRITRGAPTAWYVIVIALALLLLRRTLDLYYGLQTEATLAYTEETTVSFLVALFLSTGLMMLARTFRRQLKIAQQS